MKAKNAVAVGAVMIALLSGTMLAGCGPVDSGGPSLYARAPAAPPPPPYDPDKVGNAISDAAGSTPKTTIYTNVLNGSGGSCVEASTTRGRAIADRLTDMKSKGEIPPDHTVEVHTYSGYRLPVIGDSVHTYTVTQVKGPDGKVKDTWTSDNYLGPNSTTHYTGDGGYTNWATDFQTNEVNPTNMPPKPTKPRTGGSGGGGGGAGGGGGGGGGGEG